MENVEALQPSTWTCERSGPTTLIFRQKTPVCLQRPEVKRRIQPRRGQLGPTPKWVIALRALTEQRKKRLARRTETQSASGNTGTVHEDSRPKSSKECERPEVDLSDQVESPQPFTWTCERTGPTTLIFRRKSPVSLQRPLMKPHSVQRRQTGPTPKWARKIRALIKERNQQHARRRGQD